MRRFWLTSSLSVAQASPLILAAMHGGVVFHCKSGPSFMTSSAENKEAQQAASFEVF